MGTFEKLLLAGAVFSILTFFSYRHWKSAFLLNLYLLVLEGAFRKWFFSGFQEFIYLLKDFILSGIYLRFLLDRNVKQTTFNTPNVINFLVLCLLFWCIPQIFNPSLPSSLLGVFGLKTYLYYIPIAFILPSVFHSKEEFLSFLFKYSVFSIPIGLLGIVQFFSPVDSPLVSYVGDSSIEEASISVAGENVRITGTFSYISGYSVYLIFTFSISFGLLFIRAFSRSALRITTTCFFVLSIVNSLMTGSRQIPLYWFLFILLFLFLGGFFVRGKVFQALPRLVFVSILAGVVVFLAFPQAIEAIGSRVQGSEVELFDRTLLLVTAPLEILLTAPPFGIGIGATHPAAKSLVPDLPLFSWVPFALEGEPERVIVEIGQFGFGLFMGVKLIILFYLYKFSRYSIKDQELRLIGLIGILYLALNLLTPIVFNATGGFYFWFVAGFTFLLPNLDPPPSDQSRFA